MSTDIVSNDKNILDLCWHCEKKVEDGEAVTIVGLSRCHKICVEKYEIDYREHMQSLYISDKKDAIRGARILKRLKKRLHISVYEHIIYEFESHDTSCVGIVSLQDVSGSKLSGSQHFDMPTKIRHVYEDVSQCEFSGSYGGTLFLYIGNQQYLKMNIAG